MSAIKTSLAVVAAIGFMCGSTAMAAANSVRYWQDQYVEPMQAAAPTGGRQVYHPAWSFGCAEKDVSERIIPCDEPVWVYGEPCEVGTGVQGQTRPCDNGRNRQGR